uniref:Uncharacterized protein n=1 Tax=Oryzias latipes TaxID=8090 RepID=A0A3B3I964_ORYLA
MPSASKCSAIKAAGKLNICSVDLFCRAILFELGLQGKLTTDQLAKKWDNLKRRYKELKFPSRGVDTNPSSWPWFYRMNDAMEGRFSCAAPILTPIVEDEDDDCEPLSPTPKKRARRSRGGMAEFLTETNTYLRQDAFGDNAQPDQRSVDPCDRPLGELDREWEMVERERAALEREREMVERERATVERERAAVQAERLWLDRERAAVERDRAMVEQERLALGRERDVLDQRALMLNSVGHSGHLSSLM